MVSTLSGETKSSCNVNHLPLRYDSLTGVPCTQKTVAFERAAVLFNIGGLYTQVHSVKGSLGFDLLTLKDGDEAQPKHRRGARECRG